MWLGYLACRPIQQPFSATLHMFGRFDRCGFSKADKDIFKLKLLIDVEVSLVRTKQPPKNRKQSNYKRDVHFVSNCMYLYT